MAINNGLDKAVQSAAEVNSRKVEHEVTSDAQFMRIAQGKDPLGPADVKFHHAVPR